MGVVAVPFDPVLCLEFANTNAAGRTADGADRLPGFEDLVDWLVRQGALPTGSRAKKWAKANPARAARLLARARRLREAVFAVMSARAEGREAPRADLDLLSTEAVGTMEALELVPGEGGFAWRARGDAAIEPLVLYAPALSAASLLTGDDLPRVRVCANQECGWLFLDSSKNQTRKWCDMGDCGNRMKARRRAARLRAGKHAP